MKARTPFGSAASGTTPPPGDGLAEGRTEVLFASAVAAGFGPYLRGLRIERGLSLRDAAADMGISFTYLQKLETGVRSPRPSMLLLQQLAAVYGRPTQEVLSAAGARPGPPEEEWAVVESCFRRLVLHPRLMPLGMDEKFWLDSFSTRQKRQLVEFAQRVQAYVREIQNSDQPDVFDIIHDRPLHDPERRKDE